MSRIGKRPVALPKGVTVTAKAGMVEIKGPKGTVSRKLPSELTLTTVPEGIAVEIKKDVQPDAARALHGTARAQIASGVKGVTDGFKANLKLEGTGYRAELKGTSLTLTLGFSHPVVFEVPKAVSVKIPPESKNTVLQLESFDKDTLGQTVAKLQSFRPPEPYKGKGVQLEGQKIRRKAGKSGGKGGKGGK